MISQLWNVKGIHAQSKPEGSESELKCIYMKSRRIVLVNLFAERKGDAGIEHGLVDMMGKERVEQTEKVSLRYIHCHVYNRY